MTITKLLAEGCRPTYTAERFLHKITELEPLHAFQKSAVVPEGAYLVPFANPKGFIVAWVPFATRPSNGSPVYVELEYPKDGSRVYMVTAEGLRVVSKAVNEDY